MKKVLICLALLLAAISSFAQGASDYHFKLSDNALVWQRVFPADTCDLDVVILNLLNSGYFRNIEVISGVISCEVSGIRANYKSPGYTRMGVPIYISNGVFYAHALIQLKDNRYRVTLSRIEEYNEGYGTSAIIDFAVTDGRFKEDFARPAGHVLDYTFTSIFYALAKQRFNDDW